MPPPQVVTSLLALTIAAQSVVLPLPPGPKNVTLTTGELVDHSRLDPYAPTPGLRALMVSVFQPASCASAVAVDYMPPATAKYDTQALAVQGWPTNYSFTDLQQQVCPDGPMTEVDQDAPVVLFSPGYRMSTNALRMIVTAPTRMLTLGCRRASSTV